MIDWEKIESFTDIDDLQNYVSDLVGITNDDWMVITYIASKLIDKENEVN